MGGQCHAPAALHPGKRPGTYRIEGWVGSRAGLDGCGKISPLPGFDPRTVHPAASRYTGDISAHFRDNILSQTSRFGQSKTLVLLEHLKMEPSCCTETSVTKYQATLRNLPGDKRPQIHRDGNLKYRKFK